MTRTPERGQAGDVARSDELDLPRVHPETRAEWRAWLEAHHATERGCWLVSWKKATGKPIVPYDDVVEEALCFGWIDSVVNKLDDERSMLLITPRKKGSTWARSNKQRVERLRAAGLMTPAGQAVIDRAEEDGSWTVLDQVEDLVEPDDLAAALDAVPDARRHWDAFSPSYRKQAMGWIVTAKRDATRARRIAEVVRLATEDEKANQQPRT